MSDRKISELTNITGANLVDADEFVVVDISADETKAITFGELKEAFDTGSGFVRITGDTMTGDLTVPNVITSGNVDGRDVSADGTKLDTIETNADVTDTTNVTAAGALMTSGGTMTGDVAYGDNVKATFGASADLQIYHTGGSSYIEDAGTGQLILKTDGADIRMIDGSSNQLVTAVSNGSVKLGYGSAGVKLETIAGGISVTGNATFADNDKAIFGAGSDLQIYHTGSTSYIYEQGTGDLRIRGNEVRIEDGDGSTIALFQNNAGAQLRYNGTSRLETTSTGIDVTGTVVADGLTVDVADGYGVNLAGGTGSFSEASYYWAQGQRAAFGYDGSAVSISDINQNGVTANKPLRISLGGADRLLIDHSTGDISFYEDTGTTAKLMWDASDEALEFGDNVKATFGASADLQVFHDGSNSFIKDAGTGNLRIDATNLQLRNGIGTETYATFTQDNAVELYYDNTKRLETSSTGSSVYGSLLAYASSSNDWALRGYNSATSALSGLWFANDSAQFLGRNSSNTLTVNINSNGSSYFNGGNVGIGTSNPASDLHVADTGESVVTIASTSAGSARINMAGAGGGSAFVTSTVSSLNLETATSSDIVMRTDATERLRVYGTSGDLEMTGGGSIGWANFTFKEESGYLYVYNGSTKIMRVDASGNAAFAGDVEANATL